jgi:DNA-binding GntR family transcriptional regulator
VYFRCKPQYFNQKINSFSHFLAQYGLRNSENLAKIKVNLADFVVAIYFLNKKNHAVLTIKRTYFSVIIVSCLAEQVWKRNCSACMKIN